ncbi:MAG: ATP-dependent sacrificial sulfur transferase LarE [Armatimonadota bacterium]
MKNIIADLESVAVAYSGGVDSAFLAKTARDVLNERAFAVLGVSPTVAKSELDQARELAISSDLQLIEVETNELADSDYAANPTNRCYFCKNELFGQIFLWAKSQGIHWVTDGANADDKGDWRPGSQAALEHGVRSPLAEAGLTKDEIRAISKEMGLPTWDKPSIACLGSRFPYGSSITPEKIRQLDKAEDLLRSLGFKQLRVRHHDEIARIEVEPQEIARMATEEVRLRIVEGFRKLGFKFVTLDLAGYVMGSLNYSIVTDILVNPDARDAGQVG